MPIRDSSVVRAASETPFQGYSVRPVLLIKPDVDRVVALVAVLGTMLLSGIVLGRQRP